MITAILEQPAVIGPVRSQQAVSTAEIPKPGYRLRKAHAITIKSLLGDSRQINKVVRQTRVTLGANKHFKAVRHPDFPRTHNTHGADLNNLGVLAWTRPPQRRSTRPCCDLQIKNHNVGQQWIVEIRHIPSSLGKNFPAPVSGSCA